MHEIGMKSQKKFGSHIPDARVGGEIRAGRTRSQTRALQQESSNGLIAMLGPNEGGQVIHALVAEQVENSNGLPTCSMKEVEPEPTSYTAACKSQYSEVWKKSMEAEFAG